MAAITYVASVNAFTRILTPGFYPLMVNKPVTLLADVDPTKRIDGRLPVYLDINVHIPVSSTFHDETWNATVDVPFWCDSDGYLHNLSQAPTNLDRDKSSSLDIDVYTWTDRLLGWPLSPVRPPNIRVLHILMMATLNGWSPKSVTTPTH